MEYQIEEKRLKYLIIKIVRNLDIKGLYRVSIELQTPPLLVLYFDTVFSTNDIHDKTHEVEQTLEGILGISFRVLPISYSEAKYHLRKPRNI